MPWGVHLSTMQFSRDGTTREDAGIFSFPSYSVLGHYRHTGVTHGRELHVTSSSSICEPSWWVRAGRSPFAVWGCTPGAAQPRGTAQGTCLPSRLASEAGPMPPRGEVGSTAGAPRRSGWQTLPTAPLSFALASRLDPPSPQKAVAWWLMPGATGNKIFRHKAWVTGRPLGINPRKASSCDCRCGSDTCCCPTACGSPCNAEGQGCPLLLALTWGPSRVRMSPGQRGTRLTSRFFAHPGSPAVS